MCPADRQLGHHTIAVYLTPQGGHHQRVDPTAEVGRVSTGEARAVTSRLTSHLTGSSDVGEVKSISNCSSKYVPDSLTRLADMWAGSI